MECLQRFLAWALSPIAFLLGLRVYTAAQVEDFEASFGLQAETIRLQQDLLSSYLDSTADLRAWCAELRVQLSRARRQVVDRVRRGIFNRTRSRPHSQRGVRCQVLCICLCYLSLC